jgi:hypothetical protein
MNIAIGAIVAVRADPVKLVGCDGCSRLAVKMQIFLILIVLYIRSKFSGSGDK